VKILLTGVTGQVGSELARSLKPLGQIVAARRKDCDFTQPQDARDFVSALAPDVVVNAAAYTAVDKAETDESTAMLVNATTVGVLAEEARRNGALLLHYSTDYVFDGMKQLAYLESDPPGPLNAYGRSKLAGEQAIRSTGCDHLIFRTSWVYAAQGHNFLNSIIRWARERGTLRVVDDQHGAPTWARNIADATATVLHKVQAQRRAAPFVSGTYHLTARGHTTWCGFARAILAGIREKNPSLALPVRDVVPIATADYPTPARRPRNSRLDGTALMAQFGVVMPEWEAALRECLSELPGPGLAGPSKA
jgi:dTDP-4-dehydrorhamnose reductase